MSIWLQDQTAVCVIKYYFEPTQNLAADQPIVVRTRQRSASVLGHVDDRLADTQISEREGCRAADEQTRLAAETRERAVQDRLLSRSRQTIRLCEGRSQNRCDHDTAR